jgi:regulator of sigma E protease
MKQVDKTPLGKFERGLLGIVSTPRAAVVGVPSGSAAEAAGLKTFDRILSVNGSKVRDELQLRRILAEQSGALNIVVVRSDLREVGGAGIVWPSLATVVMEKLPGEGLRALGAESADVYVWTVFPGTPAAKAGLKRGDRIVSINEKPMTSWLTLDSELRSMERKSFQLAWTSGGAPRSADLAQEGREELDELKNRSERLDLGIRPRPVFQGAAEVLAAGFELERVTIHLGPFDALVASVQQVPQAVKETAIALGRLLTRDISFDNLGGPILLFQVASKSAEAGAEVFLRNMALVSVNLGLVNLLPIPILDGFGLLAALWEGIRRRPIPARTREIANIIGFSMLVLLMLGVFWNDIARQLR